MPTNNNETPDKKTLRERVQSFRDKATRLLRMGKINKILQEIFQINKAISYAMKQIEILTEKETSAKKMITRAEYKITKLDEADPDYEDKKAKAMDFVETETKRQKETLEQIDNDIKSNEKEIIRYKEQVEKLDKEIEAVESGETKVSIEEVNDLAQKLIAKS